MFGQAGRSLDRYLGQAFAKKQWHREAAETFERALASDMSEERAKEIRYYLGDAQEKMGELERARDCFSEVAQLDFNYRDVRQRMEAIREKLAHNDQSADADAP